MTEEEIIICRMYLKDLDKYHSCNEYLLLMRLLDEEDARIKSKNVK